MMAILGRIKLMKEDSYKRFAALEATTISLIEPLYQVKNKISEFIIKRRTL